jgi:hypothetical protein
MSIEEEIIDRVERRMLFPLEPLAPGVTIRRAMFIGESLWKVLNAPSGPDTEWEERIGRLQADLEIFISGENITPKYLFLLFPKEEAVWEIRSVQSDPSIRVLGLFAQKDVFISTNFELRENLGGWENRAWKNIKKMAKTIWRNLFNTYLPITTTNVDDVCSGAINAKFYKERT